MAETQMRDIEASNDYRLHSDKNMTIRPAPSILELCKLHETEKEVIEFMREVNILSAKETCKKCKKNMRIRKKKKSKQKVSEIWKCGSCGNQWGIRRGSFWFVSDF